MINDFSDIISKYFLKIKGHAFKKMEITNKNFYFIYKFSILKVRDELSTLEMDPLGIILEENGKYYLYSLNEELNEYLEKNEKEIIEDFINSTYLGNGIFSGDTRISIK